ncbi:MAG: phosphatase PAP2 family protein, partial [Rhizobiaceae bacterium]
RIGVGAHFPSDVLAGLSLGFIFTWIYARSFARKRLLFEFGSNGELRLRNLAAKRARRKIRKRAQAIGDLGFGTTERRSAKKA